MNIPTHLKILFIALLAITSFSVHAESVTINASRDTTLIEDPDGALANGSGPALFVGRTGQAVNGSRRALLWFDVAGILPVDAVIDDAFLTLHLSRGNPGATPISVYRVLADWGEGASSAAGGGGAPAEPGDSTWLHTFYDMERWGRDGGRYRGHASASKLFVGGAGFYTWSDPLHLVNDIRYWIRLPDRNFGWVFVGDEETLQSVQRFDSRESPTLEYQPTLTIEYHLPGGL